jgi:hypothetical protein
MIWALRENIKQRRKKIKQDTVTCCQIQVTMDVRNQ